MSTGSENLTYGQALEKEFPNLFKKENIWALICIGDNLEDPAEGWAGFSVVPVFVETAPFNLFFGNMSEQLMEWENVAPFNIERSVSQDEAFRVLRDLTSGDNHSPVLISSNAHTWVKPIIETFKVRDTQPFTPVFLCLRDLYSAVVKKLTIGSNPFELFQSAPALPKKFGLHRIAEDLGAKAGLAPTKAQYRAELTGACSRALMQEEYPSEGN